MDGDRFAALLRSLVSRASRRGVFAGLTSGLLALLAIDEVTEARNRKKKGKGKKKKRPRCKPRCAGKRCGPDGCGGSCGSCNGGATCDGGTCVCAGDLVFCRGACVPGCIGEAIINPLTCDCCQTGLSCQFGGDCCSGICQPQSGGGDDLCVGRDIGRPCDFDAQCNQTSCRDCPLHTCRDGFCDCADGLELCLGVCMKPCAGGNARNPTTCSCCRRTNQSCTGITPCCSEHCLSGTCVPRAYGDPCLFNEQCASDDCHAGFCRSR